MRLRTPLSPWTAALFTSLGLSPLVACGGTVVGQSDRAETGGGYPGGAEGSTGGASGAGGTPWYGGGGLQPAGGAGPLLPQCENPSPRLGPDGKPTGFVDCAGGTIHRAEKRDCASRVSRADRCPGALLVADGGPQPYGCQTDADCSGQPHAHCVGSSGSFGPPLAGCYCATGCVTDAECGQGQICLCGDPVGQCVAASCTTKGDCPGQALCMSYGQSSGCGSIAFACQTYQDTCASDGDCQPGSLCTLTYGGRMCQPRTCVTTGRPFLVDGAARIAGVAHRRDWSSSLTPCLDGLDQTARDALALHWTKAALMEHASIAAFALFALEIMSLGAPPELVIGTHEAMADETVHARDAFALASAYAGRAVGPGKLDVGAAPSSRSPLDIVRTTILEGCIGEAVAAVEAAEALSHATDPAVREALARVTMDETRHAELAWRFVQWVLAHSDAGLRAEAASDLVTLVESERGVHATARGREPSQENAKLAAHGATSEATRIEIRRRVIDEIVRPCAHALSKESRKGARPSALA